MCQGVPCAWILQPAALLTMQNNVIADGPLNMCQAYDEEMAKDCQPSSIFLCMSRTEAYAKVKL